MSTVSRSFSSPEKVRWFFRLGWFRACRCVCKLIREGPHVVVARCGVGFEIHSDLCLANILDNIVFTSRHLAKQSNESVARSYKENIDRELSNFLSAHSHIMHMCTRRTCALCKFTSYRKLAHMCAPY
jgi:hypothetical protein